MSTLFVNDIFQTRGSRHRLLKVATAAEQGARGLESISAAYVVRVDGPLVDPVRWDLKELTALSKDPAALRVVAEAPRSGRPVHAGEKDLVIRDKRWSRIKGVATLPGIWEKETRACLLRTHAANIGVSEKTLVANLRLYWANGQTLDGLLGGYFNSGRIEQSTSGSLVLTEKTLSGPATIVFAPASQHARGRRPIEGGYEPLSMPPDLRARILDIARKHVEEDECKSVHGASTVVLEKMFALYDAEGAPLRDADGGAVLKPLGQRPSFDQIRYLLKRTLVLSGTWKKRNGVAPFDNNHAPATGSVLDDCLGPGDVYEIDATIMDLWVVAKADRRCIIGKPCLFLVVDRASRLIVGFYITLENPSWTEATQAILSIGGDWEALCKRLGVPYDVRDWPARNVLCNRFFGDRADMITYASNALCDGLDVQVTNAPALHSRRKPIVESSFKVQHGPLREHAPGYEPPTNPFKRRGKKYHGDASMTLDEAAAVELRIIIAHNRSILMGYQSSAEEILGNLPCSPREIFKRHVEERMGSSARMPIDLMRRKLMPRDVGFVKNDGIHFKGLIYEADALKEWFVRASLRGEFEVVMYTPNLVNSVIVYDKFDATQEHVLRLTSTSAQFKGYTFAEVAYVTWAAAKNKRAAKHFNDGQDVARLQDMKSIMEPAVAATKIAAKGFTPGMRLSGGDAARAAEADERRRATEDPANLGHHYGSLGADSDFQPAVDISNAVVITAPDAAVDFDSTTPSAATPATPSNDSTTDPDLTAQLNSLLDPS